MSGEVVCPLNPLVVRKLVDANSVVVICDYGSQRHYWRSDRYERFQNFMQLTGNTWSTLRFVRVGISNAPGGGGARKLLRQSSYTLKINDQAAVVSDPIVPNTSYYGYFRNIDLTDYPDKSWLKLEVDCDDTIEFSIPWFVFLNRSDVFISDPPKVPFITSSHEVREGTHTATVAGRLIASASHVAWPRDANSYLPPRYTPRPMPLLPRDTPYFSHTAPPEDLYRLELVPRKNNDIYRTNITERGVYTTFNQQAYKYSQLIKKIPTIPMLDGPRGVGNFQFPTHIQVDRNGGVHALDPWRLVRISADGTIETRAGYRHRQPLSQWGREHYPADMEVELVGDWSSIPSTRHGFHETWGMAWDTRTLAIDSSKKEIGPPANRSGFEHPHVTGPTAFIADSQGNRIAKLKFSPTDHTPPVVTEFLYPLNDPWDCVFDSGILYVSIRKDHRVAAYNATTGAFIRNVLQSNGTPDVNPINFNRRAASYARTSSSSTYMAALRQHPIVYPEGLFFQDGWLYVASSTQGEVRKVNVTTGELVVVCRPLIDDKSEYCKIAMSDGTFGPRGTVFTWTWANADFGYPQAFLPSGGEWKFKQDGGGLFPTGRGGNWTTLGYGAAGGVGLGRMVCGSSQEGLVQLSLALPSDTVPSTTRFRNGAALYSANEFKLTHGQAGYGNFGWDMPWGKDDDLDYYLELEGQSRNSIRFRENIWVVSTDGTLPPPDPDPDPQDPTLPAKGEAKLIAAAGGHQAILAATGSGKTEQQHTASLFESYGSGVFNPYYSTHGAFVITGTGGHNHQETFGGAIFDFTDRTWKWRSCPQIAERNTPIQLSETTGSPWYEMPGTTVPAPSHPFRTMSVVPPKFSGPKGAMVYVGRGSVANNVIPGDVSQSFTSRTSHIFDCDTGLWTRANNDEMGIPSAQTIECNTVWDPVLERFYTVRSDLHYHKDLPYLDPADWTYKKTTPQFADWPESNNVAYATAIYAQINGRRLVMHNWGQLFQVLDLDNMLGGFVQPQVQAIGDIGADGFAWPRTIINGFNNGSQMCWVWHEDQGVFYYRHHWGFGNTLWKLVPPIADPLSGVWTISEITLGGDVIPEHGSSTIQTTHYRSLFYIPSLKMLGWVTKNGVALLNP